LKKTLNLKKNRTGAFYLNVKKREINILALDNFGLIYGLVELENRLDAKALKEGEISSFPNLKYRYVHAPFTNKTSLKQLKEIIELSYKNKYNGIILSFKNRVELNSMKGMIGKFSIPKQDLQTVISYGKSLGLEMIPEVKFLTHQNFLIRDKLLLFNEKTYDPTNENVYKIVFPIIDEVSEMFQSSYFHIGHDELFPKPFKDDKHLSAELFLKDIEILHGYLKGKNIKTMMWADMLFDKKQFKSNKGASVNGDKNFQQLLDKLPKDILMCDWRYFDDENFGPTKLLIDKGFVAFGASWYNPSTIDNLSSFIYKNNTFENSGMIATTWEGALAKHEKESGVFVKIDEIINYSGKVFWNGK
jgi:hypothetical protein